MTIKQLLKKRFVFIKDIGIIVSPILTLVSFVYLYSPWNNILNKFFFKIIFVTLLVGFSYAVIKRLYAYFITSITVHFKNPNFHITIKYGDLFQEKNNIIIGINNYFDTFLGQQIIAPTSIQGQFEEKYYKDNISNFDNDIDNSIKRKKVSYSENKNKKRGKIKKYPIGTTVTIKSNNRCVFLCAYCNMNKFCKAKSNIEYLTTSLNELWKEIRNNGECNPVAMALLGTGLSRINISNESILKLILIHFISSSNEEIITKHLTIVLNKKDKNLYNLSNIENKLKELSKE